MMIDYINNIFLLERWAYDVDILVVLYCYSGVISVWILTKMFARTSRVNSGAIKFGIRVECELLVRELVGSKVGEDEIR